MLILNTGTQYVEGELSFEPGFQIFLYESVFNRTGEYVLFDYSSGSFPGGQTELNNNVTVTAVDLKLSYISSISGISVLEDQPEHKRIIVKLLSKPTNGKQWIDGDLIFAGPTTLYLDQHLFTTQGVYELFEVTGVIQGIENLTVIHDGGWFTATPYLDPFNNGILKIGLEKVIGVDGSNVAQSFAFSPELVRTISQLNPQVALVDSTVIDPVVSNAFEIILHNELTVFNPSVVCNIKSSVATVDTTAFQIRTTIGLSYWYDYFPMASFEGDVDIDSEFKIMLLNENGVFVSTQKDMGGISPFKVVEKPISLKNIYIDEFGRVIYDFDSVTWESAYFTFSNAVIYANDIPILHISWAIPFALSGDNFTLKLPEITPKAQPTANFGTLDFEPYVRYPAIVSADAIKPLFPYVFPEVSIVESKVFSPSWIKLNLGFATINTVAFDLSQAPEEIDAEPFQIIELFDEDYANVDCFSIDQAFFQGIETETCIVDIKSQILRIDKELYRDIEDIVIVDSVAIDPVIPPPQEISLQTISVDLAVFNPVIPPPQEISLQTISVDLAVFNLSAVQTNILRNIDPIEATAYDPDVKNTMSLPIRSFIQVFDPGIEQTLRLNTAFCTSNAVNIRFARDESFWYDYFPMASFEGEIKLDSEFKIMLLDSAGVFESKQRFIGEISNHKVGDVKTIELKNIYVNHLGEAIYDFDSPVWESANFTFQNAVIYANDILVLHISWAQSFVLNGEDLTLQLPETFALARPVMRFGTLEFEPYVRFAAQVNTNVIEPLFPYKYPQTAIVKTEVINPGFVKLEIQNAFVDAFVFNPSFEDEIDDSIDVSIIELFEEDICFVDVFAFDPSIGSVISLDHAPVLTTVYDLIGPPIVKVLNEYAYVQQVEVCSPIVENIIEDNEPQPDITAPSLSLCSDPFVEWKPTNRISMQNYSKLIGYWPFDRVLADESIYDNNIELTYSSGNEDTILDKLELAKFGLGFRGNSLIQGGSVISDKLTVNSRYNFEKNFSSQIWVKIDNKRIFQDGPCIIMEQFDGCWSNSGPIFPGGLGWTLYSTPIENNQIKFSFSVVNSQSSISVDAIFSDDVGGVFDNLDLWYHFVCVRRENNLILYVNGIKFEDSVSQGDFSNIFQVYQSLKAPLTIGHSNRGINGILRAIPEGQTDLILKNNSVIDDVAIWRKSLTDDDVSFLWAGGAGNSAESLPPRRTNINTRTIDRFRQGVELTQEIYFHVGIYQAYSGDKVHHRLLRHDYGLQIWDYGNCKHYFVDKEEFKGEEIVQTERYERFLIGERHTTDGVISVSRGEDIKSINDLIDNRQNSISRTSFVENNFLFISDIPILSFIDNKINPSTKITPFDDEFNTNEVILTGAPNGFISQPNGADYDLRIIRGTDSLSFGGETY